MCLFVPCPAPGAIWGKMLIIKTQGTCPYSTAGGCSLALLASLLGWLGSLWVVFFRCPIFLVFQTFWGLTAFLSLPSQLQKLPIGPTVCPLGLLKSEWKPLWLHNSYMHLKPAAHRECQGQLPAGAKARLPSLLVVGSLMPRWLAEW